MLNGVDKVVKFLFVFACVGAVALAGLAIWFFGNISFSFT